MQELEIIAFGKTDIKNVFGKMLDKDLNELAFGAIERDKKGPVLKYNSVEGAITGRDPATVSGKNFFREVAPCTAKPASKGLFEAGAKANNLNPMFEYVFDHQMQSTKVKVHMKRAISGASYWVFVKLI